MLAVCNRSLSERLLRQHGRMAESFERHGFEPAYEVVVNPEFPANGVWPVPVHRASRSVGDGSRPETVPTRWGAPFIASAITAVG